MKQLKLTSTLVVASLLCSQVSEVFAAKLRLKPIGYDWKDNGEGKEFQEMDFDLNTDHITMSGFSSGGFMTNNLLVMFNNYLKGGASIAASGPCAGAGICGEAEPSKVTRKYDTRGLQNMPVYIWGGNQDMIVGTYYPGLTADYFKKQSSDVKEEYEDCGHVY